MEISILAEPDHDALREAAEMYVLGRLDDEERARFEAHLSACVACAEEVRRLSPVAVAMAHTAPQVDPPAELRARVLSSLSTLAPQRSSRRAFDAGWLAAAAMLVISASLAVYAASLRQRIRVLEQEVADAARANEATRVRLAVLTAPDLSDVPLKGQASAPAASGRALWSRTRGLLFAASALPALPEGRTYQVWYLTQSAPVSAGLVKPDASGQASALFETPAAITSPAGFAVSIEPEGGVPSPTGAIYLAGTTQ